MFCLIKRQDFYCLASMQTKLQFFGSDVVRTASSSILIRIQEVKKVNKNILQQSCHKCYSQSRLSREKILVISQLSTQKSSSCEYSLQVNVKYQLFLTSQIRIRILRVDPDPWLIGRKYFVFNDNAIRYRYLSLPSEQQLNPAHKFFYTQVAN